ncbi:MAG: 2-amino-4-hydroxy-6-hydroxymethyldihydropteridine diphosphokinase [Verrucomicrobia bacterium]|nr:2-amino-4-hydroxy-6-hydroxymethyldihydropteridine diphosphokinase [Verrucomicrobiota bacterium]
MSTAYLGLGGNLGSRRQYLADAVLALNSGAGIHVEKISSVYQTKPVGVVDQPDFFNLVVQVASSLTARELLVCCLQIETKLGRVRAERWGPRTIDLDVLWFDGVPLNEADLVLPHPRLKERAFVLVPLAEIAPTLLLDGVRVDELATRLDQSGLQLLGSLDSLPA